LVNVWRRRWPMALNRKRCSRQALIDALKKRRRSRVQTRDANEQHYEVPTEFYQLCLGPRLKYSSVLL
jgi:cyclopropane-fatty-acyl-phospholipid synthase